MSYSKSEIVNTYINKELSSDIKPLFLEIRKTILETEPDLNEDIKWKNCLTYSLKKNMIQTVVGKSKITLIFFEGAQLSDPENLLEGDGKKTRSYRIENGRYNKSGLKDLVRQASNLMKP